MRRARATGLVVLLGAGCAALAQPDEAGPPSGEGGPPVALDAGPPEEVLVCEAEDIRLLMCVDRSPRVTDPTVREVTVQEITVQEVTVQEVTIQSPTVREVTIQEPTVREVTVQEPTVREVTVQEPAVRRPTVRRITIGGR